MFKRSTLVSGNAARGRISTRFNHEKRNDMMGYAHCEMLQLAPRPDNTCGIVNRMILASRPSDHVSMY